MPPPTEQKFEEATLTPMARSFYLENKRISNQKIKQELGITLTYPTYREGLNALLETEKAKSKKLFTEYVTVLLMTMMLFL